MALRESGKAGEDRKTKTGWSRQELLRDCDKSRTSGFARLLTEAWVSRFRDSKYRGTSAKNEAQAVVMDQKKNMHGNTRKTLY